MSVVKSKTIYDYILKFIIVGESSVGKSNILLRFTDNRFQSSHDLTIGVEFATKIISKQNTIYKLQIWDTAGQEAFRSITRSYYRGTICCLMVYDVTNRTSFESLIFWINDLKKYCDPDTMIILVGNKTDLRTDRKVTTVEGKEFADTHNISFFETSAKTGDKISDCFIDAVDKISKKLDAGKIDLIKSKGCVYTNHVVLGPDVNHASAWCLC
jgi:Ras-related protein Rab-2A